MTPEEYLQRGQEVAKAMKEYPDLEVGKAYQLWKEVRGEKATSLSTGDKSIARSKQTIREAAWKPCEKCGGKAVLEAVCLGCVEGRKGYKSKFTCESCLHRELSKEGYVEWLKRLSSSSKA